MTSNQDQGPLTPAYLRGVLTVEAELSDGSTGPDGWMRADTTSPVLVALSYVDGTASLVTEDPDGHLTRLRVPGPAFLRLIDGAERMLATSRAQSALIFSFRVSRCCDLRRPVVDSVADGTLAA